MDRTYIEPRPETAVTQGTAGRAAAHATYALYAVALFTGVPWLLGAILAYVARGNAEPLYASHLTYSIRTFWWTLLWGIVGTITTFILIGWAILGILWLWHVWRITRGWLRLADGRLAPL